MRPPARASVAIVGGGPIGLELGVALKRAGIDTVQLEAGQIGATIEWWAPGTRFFSSPERIELAGVPLSTDDQGKATRERYLAYLRDLVRLYELDVRTYERVVSIERGAGGFELRSVRSMHGVGGPREASSTDAFVDQPVAITHAERVVLAIGNMHRPRLLDVPGEHLPHVSHFFAEPHRYFGGRVLIVGGKNSAVEAALRCYRLGARVTMSYRGVAFDPRRVKYWLRPEIEWLIENGRIAWHPETRVAAIHPDVVALEPTTADGAPVRVPSDFVLLLTGYEQDASLFEQLGVECSAGDDRAPLIDRDTMESSVPGVFVAGTATGGSQRRTRVFIENSHDHVRRITRALTGREPSWTCDAVYATLEES